MSWLGNFHPPGLAAQLHLQNNPSILQMGKLRPNRTVAVATQVRADSAIRPHLPPPPTSSLNMNTARFPGWLMGTLLLPISVHHEDESSLPMLSPRAL